MARVFAHEKESAKYIDQTQLIAIDILKQDLATLAWGVVAVVPGVLTLADKLETLRTDSVLQHADFDYVFAASQLCFIAAILIDCRSSRS